MSNKEESFLSKANRYRKEIFVGILIIILLIFMIQNSHDVDFNLVFTDMDVPLIVLILGFAALGAAIVGVYWILSNRDKKRTIKDLNRKVLDLEALLEAAKDAKRGYKQKEDAE